MLNRFYAKRVIPFYRYLYSKITDLSIFHTLNTAIKNNLSTLAMVQLDKIFRYVVAFRYIKSTKS